MFRKEDRIRTEYIKSGDKLKISYVHLCKGCGKEMFKDVCTEKSCSGYCFKCVQKHKKSKTDLRNENGEKLCKCCNRYLPIGKFWKPNEHKKNVCLKCNNLVPFGINSLDYERLLEEQDYKCAICRNPETFFDKIKGSTRDLAVDHCHTTGKIRGLLCGKCNKGLGLFTDNIENLQEAIQYLKTSKRH